MKSTPENKAQWEAVAEALLALHGETPVAPEEASRLRGVIRDAQKHFIEQRRMFIEERKQR